MNYKLSVVFIIHVKETHNIVTSVELAANPMEVRNLEKPTCNGSNHIPINCSCDPFETRIGLVIMAVIEQAVFRHN
jgi:hypothetical protein